MFSHQHLLCNLSLTLAACWAYRSNRCTFQYSNNSTWLSLTHQTVGAYRLQTTVQAITYIPPQQSELVALGYDAGSRAVQPLSPVAGGWLSCLPRNERRRLRLRRWIRASGTLEYGSAEKARRRGELEVRCCHFTFKTLLRTCLNFWIRWFIWTLFTEARGVGDKEIINEGRWIAIRRG